jgi:hypothetical protein
MYTTFAHVTDESPLTTHTAYRLVPWYVKISLNLSFISITPQYYSHRLSRSKS